MNFSRTHITKLIKLHKNSKKNHHHYYTFKPNWHTNPSLFISCVRIKSYNLITQ